MTEPAAVREDYDAGATGGEQDQRAVEHRRLALAAEDPMVALLHAVLALEARLEELTCFVAQR